MFGSKKNETADAGYETAANANSHGINSLVAGTNIEGTIYASSDIRIDGNINGTLHCTGRVIIGAEGKVIGDIICENAVIEGTFEGNLKVNATLNVKESAQISGEINTNKLLVQNGAVFNVSCNMGGSKIKNIGETNPVEVELATSN